MITPAYGLTATERVLPWLALDWTTGLAQPGVDVTRAGVATFVGSDGFIQSASANTQRVDYSTSTANLLVEESRTNFVLQSENFAAVWAPAAISLDVNTIASPANTQTARKAIPNTTSTSHFYSQTIVTTNGTVYQASIYLKAGGYSWAVLYAGGANVGRYFNLDAGTIGNQFVAAPTNSTIIPVGDNWYRCTITFTATASTVLRFSVHNANGNSTFAGDGVSGVYPWGAQLEIGATPSSYIPTEATAVTRNADVPTMTGTNFSNWYNPTEGTFMLQGYVGPAGTRYALTVSDNTSNNRHSIYLNTSAMADVVVNGGALQANLAGASATQGQYISAVHAYKLNNFAFSSSGSATTTDLSGTVPPANMLNIGGSVNQAAPWNSQISKIFYWPQRLTNNEVRAFSK